MEPFAQPTKPRVMSEHQQTELALETCGQSDEAVEQVSCSASINYVSRVGRRRRVERHQPMTVKLRPLIKLDGRISRIRLSEPLHHKAFDFSV
jgi:hypothetical protein